MSLYYSGIIWDCLVSVFIYPSNKILDFQFFFIKLVHYWETKVLVCKKMLVKPSFLAILKVLLIFAEQFINIFRFFIFNFEKIGSSCLLVTRPLFLRLGHFWAFCTIHKIETYEKFIQIF